MKVCPKEYFNSENEDSLFECQHKKVILPRQITSEYESSVLSVITGALSYGMATSAVAAFSLYYLLGASLNMLWGLINTQ